MRITSGDNLRTALVVGGVALAWVILLASVVVDLSHHLGY